MNGFSIYTNGDAYYDGLIDYGEHWCETEMRFGKLKIDDGWDDYNDLQLAERNKYRYLWDDE